jgi:hypothetical protein
MLYAVLDADGHILAMLYSMQIGCCLAGSSPTVAWQSNAQWIRSLMPQGWLLMPRAALHAQTVGQLFQPQASKSVVSAADYQSGISVSDRTSQVFNWVRRPFP